MVGIKKDSELIKQFEEHKAICDSGLSTQRNKAEEDWLYYYGGSDLYKKLHLVGDEQEVVAFNRIQPTVNAVLGFSIKLRRDYKYVARMPATEEQVLYTDSCNNFASYIRENDNFNYTETEQDLDFLVTGVGITDTEDVYDQKDPNGEIVMRRITCDSVGWDPRAEQKNLLDARYVYSEYKYDIEDVLKLFPDTEEGDYEIVREKNGGGNLYNPYLGGSEPIYGAGDIDKDDRVSVYKYQWIEKADVYKIENPLVKLDEATAEVVVNSLAETMSAILQEAEENEDEDMLSQARAITLNDKFFNVENKKFFRILKTFFEEWGLPFEYIKSVRDRYYTALITGKKVIKKFASKCQDGFSLKFKTGMYDKARKSWYGLVQVMKEPQNYINKTITEMLYVIANTSKGGYITEEGAITDMAAFESSIAQTNGVAQVNDGALQKGQVQPKAQSALPTGYEKIYEVASVSINQSTGVSPEFLGLSQNKQVSGILEEQRIEQVTNGLAFFFDAIELYQIEQARLLLTLMRAISNTSTSRLVRIMGEDGAFAYEQIKGDIFNQEYEVVIQEAPQTPVQQRQQAELMLSLAQQAAVFGTNIYPEVIEFLPNLTNKQKASIKQAFEPPAPQVDPQMQQMQQEQLNLQLEKERANIEKTQAETANKQAGTAKTLTEAEQKNLENEVVRNVGVSNIAADNVNVNL